MDKIKSENICLQEVQQCSSFSYCGRIVCENELPQVLMCLRGKLERKLLILNHKRIINKMINQNYLL